mgnify:FL=1
MGRNKVLKCVANGLLLTGSSLAFVQGAAAQRPQPEERAGGLADIVVTATRRETNVQDTPLAVTAIGGDSLRDAGIVDPRQLSSLAPNLNVDQGISNGQTHVSIRGIASTEFSVGANSPVAINIDDVYQAFQYGIGTQVFDLNRIEVLRGPQGTLFGKNTTSGALNYYSQTPTNQNEGYLIADGGGGDFGHYSVEGAFNKPIGEQLAMRVSLRVDRRDDYIDNLFDGGKLGHYTNYAGRVQFKWTPTDTTTVNLKLFGMKNRGDGPVYITQYLADPCSRGGFPAIYLCGTPDSPNSRQTNSEVPIYENYHNYGATLKIDQEIGEHSLTLITGYQRGRTAFGTNDDGSSGDAFHTRQASKTEQVSQELRLATPASAPLRAVVGFYGQYDKITADQGSASTELDNPQNGLFGFDYYSGSLAVQKGTSLAGFTSVTYDVTSRLSFVGGARYSWERKKIAIDYLNLSTFNPFGPPFLDLLAGDNSYPVVTGKFPFDPLFDQELHPRDKHSWKRLTWDATANYKPSDDSLIFARAASGFRSGGYPVGISSINGFSRLDPEKVMSYELGFKSEWFDRTLRLNGSVYWTDYKDMQVLVSNTNTTGSRLTNAGKSRIKGAELEMEFAPTRALRFNASVGYNDAKFRSYVTVDPNRPNGGDFSGNRMPFAPEWTGNVGGSYEIPAGDKHSIILSTNWNYRSRIYFDPGQETVTSDKARFQGNARISFGEAEGVWRLTAYVNNLTNQNVKAFAYSFGGQGVPDSYLIAPAIYAPKRTWGAQAAFKF